jgi:hypothetical protein
VGLALPVESERREGERHAPDGKRAMIIFVLPLWILGAILTAIAAWFVLMLLASVCVAIIETLERVASGLWRLAFPARAQTTKRSNRAYRFGQWLGRVLP